MKRRPQSAAIPKIFRDKQELGMNNSQLIYQKKQPPQQVAPKEFFDDQEQLYFSNLQLKQQFNEIKVENSKLKAKIVQLEKQIVKIEKVDKYQKNCDPLGVVQSGEGSIVPILKAKVKEQRNQIEELQTDLHQQYKSVKLTKMSELHREIQNQNNEIMKLKQVIQSALNVTDQDLINDPNIVEKLSKFTITVHQQENTIFQLSKQNDKLRKEYQEMSNDNQKLIDELKQINFEKINYKKQLDEQTITDTEIYQQKKREYLEMKLAATLKQLDTIKGELSLYESKSRQLTKQIKDQEKEYKQTIMELQKQKQQLEEQNLKKELIIQDLGERIAILDLLKQKNSPKLNDSPLQLNLNKPFFPPITFREKETQFPEIQQSSVDSDYTNKPADKDRLEVLLHQLKYKIILYKLTKDRISFCFKNKEYIQLVDAIEVFMKSPFNYQKEDSIILCRYFIGEDNGKSSKIQWEDTQEVKEIISQFQTHPQLKSEHLSFQTVLQKNYFNRLLYKKMLKCNIPDKFYNYDEFVLFFKNSYNFSYEQIEYLVMINYLYSNEIDKINPTIVKHFIFQEMELQHTLHNLTYGSLDNVKFQPNKITKVTYSDDDDFNYQVVESRNSKSVSQQQKPDSGQNSEIKKPEIQNKIQTIIQTEQILTLSQFKGSDQQLRSSESRKPSNHNASDLFQYSQSIMPTQTIKRPTEFQQTNSDYSLQFNVTNQFLSPLQQQKKMSPISEFQQEIIDQRNLQFNNKDNDTKISDDKKEEDYYEEIVEEYIEDL